MKSFLAGILIILAAALPAECRIGETLDDFTNRYGAGRPDNEKARMPGHDQYLFEKDGMLIECVVTDGKCVMEVFHRRGPKITDQDVNDLLREEALGHTWVFKKDKSFWVRSDNKLQAYRPPGHNDFLFVEIIPTKAEGNRPELPSNTPNPGKDGKAGSPTELTALPPVMSWKGGLVHPSRVVTANNERVVFTTTEMREIEVPLAAVPANVAKRFEAEIRSNQQSTADEDLQERLKATGAAGIFGRVLQKMGNGVLVRCEAPDDRARFAMPGGGEAVPYDKITLAGGPATVLLLQNLPNEAALVDNDVVCVVGFVKGTWQYRSDPGVIRTVRVYSASPPAK